MKYLMYILVIMTAISCSKPECTDPTVSEIVFVAQDLQYTKLEIYINNESTGFYVNSQWIRQYTEVPVGTVQWRIHIWNGTDLEVINGRVVTRSCNSQVINVLL